MIYVNSLHFSRELFKENPSHTMSVKDFANFSAIESSIYLPELPPKEPNAPQRKSRICTPERRRWLDILKGICYPYFNENKPSSTGWQITMYIAFY